MKDPSNQFLDAMWARGLQLAPAQHLRADGGIHRCDVTGKRSGNLDGSYRLCLNGQFAHGWLNNWTDRRGVEPWHYNNGRHTLTADEQREIDLAVEAARSEDAKRLAKARAEAQVKAKRMWAKAQKAPASHAYCKRKQLKPDGLRMVSFKDGDVLLVPVRDEKGKLVNIQFVNDEGQKYGLTGGRMQGCHHWITKPDQVEDDNNTIVVCEGWATGEGIYQAAGCAVIAAFSASNLATVAEWVRGRYPKHRIIIAADDDWKTPGNPGISYAKDAARAVDGLIAIPKFDGDRGDKDTDFNDLLIASGPEAVCRAMADAVDPADMRSDMSDKHQDDLPTIKIIDGQIAHMVDQAQDALIKAQLPIFVRGGRLVEPVSLDREAADGRTTTSTLFAALSDEKVTYALNKRAATFMRHDARRKTWVKTNPPPKMVAILLGLQQWDFPEVIGIVGAPTLRSDGSILSQPGYDPQTRLWCDGDIELPPVPEQPSHKQAVAALRLYKDLLSGFPFVNETDLAVALAAMLTTTLRGAFDQTPMFLVVAHDVGNGKSYLVDLLATLVTGRACPVITPGKDIEELDKRLGAILLEGGTVVSLDNLSFDLESDLLCQVLTQQIVKTRILGQSVVPECEWRGTIFATGNNIRVLGDLVRRTLTCNLDARVERPELREFNFDPIARLHSDRAAYIAAAITIARAYRAFGHTPAGYRPLAGYGSWCKTVREPLLWLGERDPVACMEAARAADPKRAAACELVGRWERRIGLGKVVSVRDIITIANEYKDRTLKLRFPKFRALLLEHAGATKGDEIDPVRLGKWLHVQHGRVYDGLRIDQISNKGKAANEYVLVEVEDDTSQ